MRSLKFGIAFFLVLLTATVFAWKAGNRVLGQWSDGLWYPAKITGAVGADFNISFDDGDTAVLPAVKIRKIDWKVGMKVQCNWKKGGVYYTGTITKMQGESIHISYDDGDQEDSTISICRSR
jgi:hypothetical protein